MGRRSESGNHAERRRGVLRHYQRPLWRDRLFWLVGAMSMLSTAAFVAVILVITGVPDSAVGWLRPVLLGLVVLLLSFRLLGSGVTTSRHFQRGLGEGSAPRPNDLEAKGRAAGAVVGRAVRAARSPRPAPAAPADEAPTPALGTDPASAAPPATTAGQDAGDAMAPAEAEGETAPMTTTREPDPIATSEPTADPGPGPSSEAVDPPPDTTPKITADAAARSIGSMVGRRLAERRNKT